jgi:hypothetical protein
MFVMHNNKEDLMKKENAKFCSSYVVFIVTFLFVAATGQ